MVPTWLWGILLCIVSSALTALGLVLQKYSHTENERNGKENRKYYQQPIWLMGMAIFIVGQLVNLGAMALTPQTMLSCLGGLSLVFNTTYAHLILGERLRLPEIAAMAAMITGAVLVVTSTPVRPYHRIYAGDIVHDLLRPRFLIPAASISALLVCITLVSAHRLPDLKPFSWALTCAACSSYSVTLFKCGAELVFSTSRCWLHPEIYVITLIALWTCVVQVHTLNLALRRGEVTQVIPTFFALGVLFSLVQANLAFGELNDLHGTSTVLQFALGVTLVVGSTIAMVHVQATGEEDGLANLEAPQEQTPLLKDRKTSSEPSLRRNHWSLHSLSLTRTAHSMSFDDAEQFLTLSVTGPLGIA